MEHTANVPSIVTLRPRVLLQLEGAALFAAAIAGYFVSGGGLGAFFGLLLAPDVALLAYLAGPRAGAFAYNLTHTTTPPLLLGALAFAFGWSFGVSLALIWLAHIGMDRAIGYGLKHPSDFKRTHLQRA